jgi:hypothetical protein
MRHADVYEVLDAGLPSCGHPANARDEHVLHHISAGYNGRTTEVALDHVYHNTHLIVIIGFTEGLWGSTKPTAIRGFSLVLCLAIDYLLAYYVVLLSLA